MIILRGKMLARQALIRAMHSHLAARNRRRTRPTEIRRVLVIRPDHLGDLLFATPALELLRKALPGAHITGAVGPWGRAMWEGNPDLDALITIPFPGIAGHGEGGPLAPYTLMGKAAMKLAHEKYDLGITLRFDHWWGAALMWAAGIPYRVGYATPGMAAWLTHDVPYVPGKHEVKQNLRLVDEGVRRVGAQSAATLAVPLQVDRDKGEPPLQPPTPTPMPNAERILGEWLTSSRRAVIHPGTGAANKLWTIAGWAEVIANLRSQGWAVALTGSPGERRLADAIVAVGAGHAPPSLVQRGADVGARSAATLAVPLQGDTAPLLNIAGQTATPGELAWVLTQAHMVLGVDSGPLHIATALGKPTLHLYGPTDETIWGPWGDPRKHRPLRAPDTHPTGHLDVGSNALEGGPEMRAITPEMVWAQVREMESNE